MQHVVLIPARKFRQSAAIPQLAQAHSIVQKPLDVIFERCEVLRKRGDVATSTDGSERRDQVPASQRCEEHECIAPALGVGVAQIGYSVDQNQIARNQRRRLFVENRNRAARSRTAARSAAADVRSVRAFRRHRSSGPA